MRPIRLFRVAIQAIIIIALAAGCAGTAMQAMNEAHRAMGEAEKAEAERYAPVTLSIARANYEIAKEHFLLNTQNDNRITKIAAENAAEYARQAVAESQAAAGAEDDRRKGIFEEEQRKNEEIRRRDESPELAEKRYVALANRRLRMAAVSKAGARPPQGLVEIEVWIAPNGRLIQTIIIKGSPDDLLTRTVIQGLQGFKLDPFPRGMKQQYLKLRVTVDTRAQGTQ